MILCNHFFESILPQYIMAVGVFFAALAYLTSRKTNHLNTIENCSNEYRKYMRKIQNKQIDSQLKRDILGLFHKQLFYVEKSYVPKDIKIEWLNTIHSVLKENKYSIDGLQFNETDWISFERVKKFMNYLKNNTLKQVRRKHYYNLIEKIF